MGYEGSKKRCCTKKEANTEHLDKKKITITPSQLLAAKEFTRSPLVKAAISPAIYNNVCHKSLARYKTNSQGQSAVKPPLTIANCSECCEHIIKAQKLQAPEGVVGLKRLSTQFKAERR